MTDCTAGRTRKCRLPCASRLPIAKTAPISEKWLRCSKANSSGTTLLAIKCALKNRNTPRANRGQRARSRHAVPSRDSTNEKAGNAVHGCRKPRQRQGEGRGEKEAVG